MRARNVEALNGTTIGRRAFAAKVDDDSLAKYAPAGTIIVCDPDQHPLPGQLCIAATSKGAVVRRFCLYEDGKALLRAADPKVRPINVGPRSKNRIIGRVVMRVGVLGHSDQPFELGTAGDVIDFLGGDAVVARWLGLKREAVRGWRRGADIPTGWHLPLWREVERRGGRIRDEVLGSTNWPACPCPTLRSVSTRTKSRKRDRS